MSYPARDPSRSDGIDGLANAPGGRRRALAACIEVSEAAA